MRACRDRYTETPTGESARGQTRRTQSTPGNTRVITPTTGPISGISGPASLEGEGKLKDPGKSHRSTVALPGAGRLKALTDLVA
jgi:hypothetical protein